MEFRPIKKLNGTRAPQKGTLEWNDFIHLPFAKLDMIECTCFHQHKPLLYLVTKDAQMYVFDTLTKLLQCRTTYEGLVSPGAHRPVKVMQTHRFLCLAFENGELVCWDSETMALLHVHRPEKELSKKPVSVCCEGTADPIVVIANQGEQRVTILDLETFTTAKERAGGKKSIAGMCMHPTQSVLAMCCTDGEIRLWDYRTETLITSVEGAIPPSHKYFLAFDSTGEHFIVSTPTGDICVWGPQQQQQQHHQQTPQATTAGKGTDERGNTLSFYCSASLNCACEGLAFVPQNTGVPLVLTAAQGAVAGWDLVRPGSPRTPALQPSLRLRGFSLRDEAAKYAGVCPLCVPVPEGQQEPAVKTCDFVVHRNRNAVVCLPYTGFETALGANVCLYKLTVASRHLHQRCAPLAPVAQDAAVWGADATHSNCGFSFPTNAVLFLNEQNLWAYSLQSEKGFRAKQLKQPPRGPGQEASSVPVGVRASYARDATFVLWETRTTTTATEASPQSNASHLYSMIKEGKQLGVFLPGTDIAFCGDNDESYVALQEDCHTLDVGSTAGDLAGVARYELDTSLHITRVFGAPTGSAILALNCCDGEDGGNEVLLLRKDDGFIAAPDGPRLALGPGVLATQVTWQTSESGPLGALLTSDRRVVVVDQDLNVLHTFDHSSRTGEITSVFWVGYALLCTSGSQVKALYLDGTESILLTLNTQNNCKQTNKQTIHSTHTNVCSLKSTHTYIHIFKKLMSISQISAGFFQTESYLGRVLCSQPQCTHAR